MKLLIITLLTIVSSAISTPHLQEDDTFLPKTDQLIKESDKDVEKLVTSYGYPCETHQVTTFDGYLLTLHRIPHGIKGPSATKKVLYLQHGILSSSADWLLTGPEKGLAFIMADKGYDVWMGNARGNTYSRNHTTLNPDKSSEFWQFSWHEIGTIDLPAMIDYALEQTGEDAVYYAGHSQGTTSFYVMTSMRPDYNRKIKVHISLAPIAFMSRMTSPLMKIIAFWEKPLNVLLGLIGVDEFLPGSGFLNMLTEAVCASNPISEVLCSNVLFAICGFSTVETDPALLPAILQYTPAGASTKQFIHYAQEINSGKFRQFDHGLIGNMQEYNSIHPPNYDLKKVTAPVFLMYSRNDWLSNDKDVEQLCANLNNCLGKFLVAESTFNHLDYMYGIHVRTLVYDKVISLMSRY